MVITNNITSVTLLETVNIIYIMINCYTFLTAQYKNVDFTTLRSELIGIIQLIFYYIFYRKFKNTFELLKKLFTLCYRVNITYTMLPNWFYNTVIAVILLYNSALAIKQRYFHKVIRF